MSVQSSRAHSLHSCHVFQSSCGSPYFSLQFVQNVLSSSSWLEFSGTSLRRCVFEDLSKLSAFFVRVLPLPFKASLLSVAALYGEPVISSDLSSLRPVFLADLRLGFGRGDMSVTLISFCGSSTCRPNLSRFSRRQE
jgi:hypothetical protein